MKLDGSKKTTDLTYHVWLTLSLATVVYSSGKSRGVVEVSRLVLKYGNALVPVGEHRVLPMRLSLFVLMCRLKAQSRRSQRAGAEKDDGF